jgi:hypothetical protein
VEDIEFVGPGEHPVRQWCAVYDPRSGAVVHLHEHIAVGESDRRSEKQLAADALAALGPQGDDARLAVAHPRQGVALERRVRYRVRLSDRVLRSERRERPTAPPKRTL